MYTNFYSTNSAQILPPLQKINFNVHAEPLTNQQPGVQNTTGTATDPVRRHQARRIWSSGKGNLKDRFIISSTLHPAFIT